MCGFNEKEIESTKHIYIVQSKLSKDNRLKTFMYRIDSCSGYTGKTNQEIFSTLGLKVRLKGIPIYSWFALGRFHNIYMICIMIYERR